MSRKRPIKAYAGMPAASYQLEGLAAEIQARIDAALAASDGTAVLAEMVNLLSLVQATNKLLIDGMVDLLMHTPECRPKAIRLLRDSAYGKRLLESYGVTDDRD